MYTQFQRFLATSLLFSMLLQSCHNPNLKLGCEEAPNASASQQRDNAGTFTKPLPVVHQALVPNHGRAASEEKVAGNLTEEAHATSLVAPTIIPASRTQNVGNAISIPTASRTPSVQLSHTPRLSAMAQGATQHSTHKSAHGGLDDASSVKHTNRKKAQGMDTPIPVGPSTHTTQMALPPQGAVHSSQIEAKSSTQATAHQVSARAVLPSSYAQTYLSAQGHQVRFEKQAGGAWVAQVQDGWGRIQRLPVICAPDQTPEQAIQLLASKDPDQHKYWVHVLETDQPPWAPRFVYVGALVARGGGSRRDRDKFFDNNRIPRTDLFTIGIGSRGIETRFGPRNLQADAMAANDRINEAIRSANERQRLRTSISTSSLGLDTSAFTGSSLETPTFPRSTLHTPTFEPHRARERQRRQEREREEWDRESEEFFRRSRQWADEQHARAVWEAEQERERRAREEWEREQEQRRHEQEAKHDYEAFCRRETTTSPKTNSTSRQQRDESPQRSSCDPNCVAALSKQAYFLWKEQEEIRIAKEAQEQARQFYFSKWQQQEPRRRAEEQKARLDEIHRREEQRRREKEYLKRAEELSKRVEALSKHREEERKNQEELLKRAELARQAFFLWHREEELRRVEELSKEAYFRWAEERRRKAKEDSATFATPSTTHSASGPASAAQAPAARAQEDEDDHVEEVYTDYPAMHANVSPPPTDPAPNEKPAGWQPPFVARATTTPNSQEVASATNIPTVRDPEVEERCILPPYGTPFDINKKPTYGRVVPRGFLVDKEGNLRPCTYEERSMLKGFDEAFKKRFDKALKMPATPAPLPGSNIIPRSVLERMHRAVKIPPLYPEYSSPEVAPVAEAQQEDTPVRVAEEDRKMPARPSASVQPEGSSTDTVSNTQQPRSGAVVSRGFVLNSEGKLQPHEVRAPFAAPAGYWEAKSATAQDTPLKKEETRKPTANPAQANSPAEAEKSVKDYLQTFQGSTPEGRDAMQTQGEQLLKDIEALKIAKKESYRGQVETFVSQDLDPTVWNTVLKQQKDTKAEVYALRGLRSQLVNNLKPTPEVLETAGVQATFNQDNEVEYYSSDEDEQMLSSEEMKRRREVFDDVVEGIMEGGPTLGAGTAAKLAGKAPKILKAAKGVGKTVQKGTQGAAVARGVEKCITSAIKKANLPSSGKIRFIPRPSDVQSGKILQKQGGYVDKFGNVWKKAKGNSPQGELHWDVQLSKKGKQQLGHMSSSGAHLNVTNDGKIPH